jgi:hypothetical protein
MATAVTSGVVARMLEAHHSRFHTPLAPNAIKAFLEFSALPVSGADALTQGTGSLNGAGAVALAYSADTSVPTGSWWLVSGVSPTTTIAGVLLPWSQTIVWGNQIMWGTTVNVNETAWGNQIMWGTTVPWSGANTWGSNLVWNDPQSWANAIIWGTDYIGQSNGTAIIWGTSGSTPQTTAWGNLALAATKP